MAKLLVSEREYIVKHIVDDAIKVLFEKKKELQSSMIEKLYENLPSEIDTVRALYPNVINEEHLTYSSCQILRDLANFNLYLSVHHIPYKNFNFKELFDSDSYCLDKKDEIIELKKKITQIQNKTKCVLEHINTHKQLKDQFPEAYNVLMGMESEENECDSTENLRAELNSFKKS